ncbi:MAG TPA: transporter [Luteibacter sp.]|jgi:hypothetical protein|nr:transporter [Luteibacter sp.]
MTRTSWRKAGLAGCVGMALAGPAAYAQQSPTAAPVAVGDDVKSKIAAQGEQLDAMRNRIAEQNDQLEAMKRSLAKQEADYQALRRAVGLPATVAAAAVPAPSAQRPAPGPQVAQANRPVGRAPETLDRPPEVAPIFDQPGVLTPKGKFILEPSYQFGYSSADRVALVGYTVIPAILIGLVDVRQVKTTLQTAAIAMRYGFTNRFEVEVRVPYLFAHTDTVSREIFTGTAQDNAFSAGGHGIGDIEATARYQLNDGGADKAYYIGWLRVKSRTGKDPFEVVTDCVTRCVQNATGTGLPLELPRGSGFWSIQPGVTWLYPSDPIVLFGNISYLYNFTRHDVSRTVLLAGREELGDVHAGNIVDVSIGMGLALNEKMSMSIGYDQALVGPTTQNGDRIPGSVRTVLGSLLIGGSYRFNEKRTLNVTLGVGVTRDTPDANLTIRVPMTY